MPGAVIRVHTVYPEPFWREQRLSGQTLAPQSPVSVTIDQTPRSGPPGVLSTFAFGPGALEMGRLEPKERRDVWLKALAERFGPRAQPAGYLEADWSAEPWSLGGMAGRFPPGALTNYGPALRRPVGRIHWANTETATLMHGLMEGAVRSGEPAGGRRGAGSPVIGHARRDGRASRYARWVRPPRRRERPPSLRPPR
ncbi:FAD-dependent oxidoreductase [Streptomyces sp. V1I1]|uniref:flavin monoamine oxidase family protein n=1 Tax=Streptomyces sp. V1I1 TaxID=3042272 RepID=UPI0027D785AF|nr:FAD-dependent oxidoreductase [Streptomyces sp. V1I1]